MNYYNEVKRLKVKYGNDPVTRGCYEDLMKVFLNYVSDLEKLFLDTRDRQRGVKP